ncbi:hypothetical protein CBOM_07451 [Ceraceosorus bombacis]|uniref:Uncharacterized protein n=1 Tax=Ceraceosorus bombacis TaxID=401625 RepID=A0A0P1BCL4_9BASI|nr:hypothetical protein CBOM_07451 [Ceraceosorus bombacis]
MNHTTSKCAGGIVQCGEVILDVRITSQRPAAGREAERKVWPPRRMQPRYLLLLGHCSSTDHAKRSSRCQESALLGALLRYRSDL